MPTTQRWTKKSSRLGSRNYKSPKPLRFATVQDAHEHAEANGLTIKEHVSNRRGDRIQVVDAKGKARTLTVEAS